MARSLKDYLGIMVRGMAMGAADVVPGVSGGTIAFITGIYEELIDSIRSCDHRALQCLFTKGVGAAWVHINGNFLVAVLSGILLSVFSLAKLITFALETQPILIWSAFFGLIVASSLVLLKQVTHWQWQRVGSLVVGVLLALLVAKLKPSHLPETGWMMFIAGSIAICAMILPGISGSFLLLMMGLYSTVLGAVLSVNLSLLLPFAGGCAVGLLGFSHLLSWLLHRFHEETMAFLTGIMLGSLAIVWPWKHTVESTVDRHGEIIPLVQNNLMPWNYEALLAQSSQWPWAILSAVLGVILVLSVERVVKKP